MNNGHGEWEVVAAAAIYHRLSSGAREEKCGKSGPADICYPNYFCDIILGGIYLFEQPLSVAQSTLSLTICGVGCICFQNFIDMWYLSLSHKIRKNYYIYSFWQ